MYNYIREHERPKSVGGPSNSCHLSEVLSPCDRESHDSHQRGRLRCLYSSSDVLCTRPPPPLPPLNLLSLPRCAAVRCRPSSGTDTGTGTDTAAADISLLATSRSRPWHHRPAGNRSQTPNALPRSPCKRDSVL
ncbi:hypothetical protein L227DRAFT_251780 [Lentinus tigrinus ALCF2SS1-6]|uniref:Uncharacterized protein n=1 Tax=Lentinus tigrinus ALCF2SS1-6 TaxID=1328759 RepID=A0A5C2S1L8_9APHY|nr:hypothetical protein L227DRAFT_251780 [Lentinus tigrinus ALCF2SS1-6]